MVSRYFSRRTPLKGLTVGLLVHEPPGLRVALGPVPVWGLNLRATADRADPMAVTDGGVLSQQNHLLSPLRFVGQLLRQSGCLEAMEDGGRNAASERTLSSVPGLGTIATLGRMLKGEDIVVLLKLVDAAPDWTVRSIADETTIPRSVVHRAIKRIGAAGLFNERLRRVNLSQSEEFLVYGLRYVFPARLDGPSRGVPTAWVAEPLASHIMSSDELPPVWPDAFGEGRGLAVPLLHGSVVEASSRDPALGERLALVDALRIDSAGARVRGVAARLLIERIGGINESWALRLSVT